ncbi:MAG: gamma carbonic anhydrase family protein [Elusimicrobiaceae bacterium]|nr:gamma carbonic anhydrase family protein [Elusimicrobiaceae bacterium]
MIYELAGVKPDISEKAYIHETSVIIGRVKIAESASVWPCAALRGDVAGITIGKGSSVQDNCTVHVDLDADTAIGEYVTVGHGAVVHGSKIGDRCLIGMGAVVMESEIGEDCLIAAGAVITPGNRIPPRSLVRGVPGKVMRELRPDELTGLVRAAQAYLKLGAEFTGSCKRID